MNLKAHNNNREQRTKPSVEEGMGFKQEDLAREEVLCTGSLTQIQWDHLDTKVLHSTLGDVQCEFRHP